VKTEPLKKLTGSNKYTSNVYSFMKSIPEDQTRLLAKTFKNLCLFKPSEQLGIGPDWTSGLKISIMDRVSKPSDTDDVRFINKVFIEVNLPKYFPFPNSKSGFGRIFYIVHFVLILIIKDYFQEIVNGIAEQCNIAEVPNKRLKQQDIFEGVGEIINNVISGNLFGVIQSSVGIRTPEGLSTSFGDIMRNLLENLENAREAIRERTSDNERLTERRPGRPGTGGSGSGGAGGSGSGGSVGSGAANALGTNGAANNVAGQGSAMTAIGQGNVVPAQGQYNNPGRIQGTGAGQQVGQYPVGQQQGFGQYPVGGQYQSVQQSAGQYQPIQQGAGQYQPIQQGAGQYQNAQQGGGQYYGIQQQGVSQYQGVQQTGQYAGSGVQATGAGQYSSGQQGTVIG
jgi:hypothetical protein